MAGWVKYGNSCYLKIKSPTRSNTAQKDCIGQGADLVSLNSKEEMDFLVNYINNDNTWVSFKLKKLND